MATIAEQLEQRLEWTAQHVLPLFAAHTRDQLEDIRDWIADRTQPDWEMQWTAARELEDWHGREGALKIVKAALRRADTLYALGETAGLDVKRLGCSVGATPDVPTDIADSCDNSRDQWHRGFLKGRGYPHPSAPFAFKADCELSRLRIARGATA